MDFSSFSCRAFNSATGKGQEANGLAFSIAVPFRADETCLISNAYHEKIF
jgi:hypothetical protein